MEHFYLSLLLLFISFMSLSLFFLFYKHRSPFTAPNLPPGKMGYPIIGESLEFLSTGRKGHPEKFIFDRIINYSSQVFKTSIFKEPTIFFCGASCNKFLFSNENKLVVSCWPEHLRKIIPSITLEIHKESKKMKMLLPRFFKPDSLQRYIGVMDTLAQIHFASYWESKTQVTVYPLANRYTFLVASRLFMSIEDDTYIEKIVEPFNVLTSGVISMPIDLPGTPFNKAIKASNFIRKELLVIIRQRKVDLVEGKASSSQDLLSHMLTYNEEGKYMNEHDIASNILGILIAGHDPASAACTFLFKYLADLPHIYDRVYQEQMEISKSKSPGELLNWEDVNKMKYSWNVACEVMRLTPPIPGVFRKVINDFIFNGFSIPKGWKLYWSTHSTHKNPKYFPEPEKFDPRRFEGNGPPAYSFVPFGGGLRICPGKEYARLEILVFMHHLVKRFKWEMLIPNEEIIVGPIPIPAKGFPIHLYPHKAT